MDEYVNKLDYTDEEKVMEYCKSSMKAVEMTHEIVTKSKLFMHIRQHIVLQKKR